LAYQSDMSVTTAVAQTAVGRLGAMVRTSTELFVYWQGTPDMAGLSLRISDLTGRPAPELLDGVGCRYLDAASASYVPNLLPGHLYYVEVGRRGEGGFVPLAGTGPVQTPWQAGPDRAVFPAPYHRS
jgi:hypothetical protein